MPKLPTSIYQEVVYETLLAFCSFCKVQGHNLNTCKATQKDAHDEKKKALIKSSRIWVLKKASDHLVKPREGPVEREEEKDVSKMRNVASEEEKDLSVLVINMKENLVPKKGTTDVQMVQEEANLLLKDRIIVTEPLLHGETSGV